MASLDSAQLRQVLAKGVVRQTNKDTAVAIKLRAKAAAGAVTSVTVNNTAETLAMVSAGKADESYSLNGKTIGEIVDAVNAAGYFEAKVVDALRSSSIDDTLIDGAVSSTTENGITVWEIKRDSSVTLEYAALLSPVLAFDAPKGHRVHLQEFTYHVNMTTAGADDLQIYIRDARGNETKVYEAKPVDGTTTTVTFASGAGKISAGPDEEILVRLVGDAVADSADEHMRVVGLVE